MVVVATAQDAVGPAQPDDKELLRRHRPALRYDSQEAFRPLAVEAVLGSELRRFPRVRAALSGDDRRLLTLDQLRGGSRLARFDRLVAPAPPMENARRLQADDRYSNTVYGEVVRTPERIHLRYWLFFFYARETLLGSSRHQGNWQLVEVTLDAASLYPSAVTSTHTAKNERADPMLDVSWRRCQPRCAPACRHPVIHVALFTHHCHFEPGMRGSFIPFATDSTDGGADVGLPRVLPLGAWKDWPGRWGASRNSPSFPGRRSALSPRRFMRQAKRHRPIRRRRLWRLAARHAPSMPVIAAVAPEGGSVLVSWRVGRRLRRRGRWLLLTAHYGQAPAPPTCERVVRIRGRDGRTRIVVPERGCDDVVVRASVFNHMRQRSATSVASGPHTAALPPTRSGDEWPPRVWNAFHRRLLSELLAHGALTIDQLELRRVHVLELVLDRAELVALVDSARRHGLVQPLPHSTRADGSESAEVEWAPTEEGRKRAQGVVRWALRGLTVIPPVIAIALAGEVLWPLIKDIEWWLVVIGALAVVQVVGLAAVLIYRYTLGAPRRAIARHWSRHAVALPFLNHQYAERRFLAPLLTMVAGYGANFGVIMLDPSDLLVVATLVLGLAGQSWFQVVLMSWNRDAVREARAIRSAGR